LISFFDFLFSVANIWFYISNSVWFLLKDILKSLGIALIENNLIIFEFKFELLKL